MSDPLASVSPGHVSPFINRAETVNAVLESARAHRAARGGDLPGAAANDPSPTTFVHVRNDTGSSLPVFSVLALGTPIISAVDYPHKVRSQPVFPGTAPAAATDAFAIAIEPTTTSGIVLAAVLGVTVCDLNVTNASHTHAIPAAAVTATLASAFSGPAKIIWKESGTGTRRAVVLLCGQRSSPSPLTTKGDIWTYDTVDARKGVGSNGQVIVADSAETVGWKWATPLASPLTTKGDLWGFSTVDARLPVGTNGHVLTADSGEALGAKWAASGVGTTAPAWVKITKTYADLAAAATSNTITIYTLPVRGTIHGAFANHTVAFAGGSISSYVLDCQIQSGATLFGAYGVTGAAPSTGPFYSSGGGPMLNMGDGFATKAVTLTASSSGDNLDQATQGSIDIYLLVSVPPA